jgi:hypothetical protein
MPEALVDLSYSALNEEKRIEAIRTIFATCETDASIVSVVNNLMDYFNWCRTTRNNILHSELYPPSLGGDPDLLYMVKNVGKASSKRAYMKFSVERLRFIADKIREGVVQSAEIQLYLHYRGTPIDKVPDPYKPYADGPPKRIKVPHPVEPTEQP